MRRNADHTDDLTASIERVVRRAEDQITRQGHTGMAPLRRAPDATPPPAIDPVDRARRARFAELRSWGIPYQEARFILERDQNGFYETQPVAAARQLVAMAGELGAPNILVLAGPKGVGKTVAAVLVADTADPPLVYGETWSPRQHPIFRHVSELIGLFRDTAARQRMSDAKVLVLDDLGVEYQDKNGIFLALLDALLNARYGAAGLTVITTNLSAGEFEQHVGARIYDRLRGRGDWWDCPGESLRGGGAHG